MPIVDKFLARLPPNTFNHYFSSTLFLSFIHSNEILFQNVAILTTHFFLNLLNALIITFAKIEIEWTWRLCNISNISKFSFAVISFKLLSNSIEMLEFFNGIRKKLKACESSWKLLKKCVYDRVEVAYNIQNAAEISFLTISYQNSVLRTLLETLFLTNRNPCKGTKKLKVFEHNLYIWFRYTVTF